MRYDTHQGFQEDGFREESFPHIGARQVELIKAAPTEPEAFLLWGAGLQREDGRFELSRGRVTGDMINASRPRGRVARNLVLELGRLLDLDKYDINAADFAVRTPFGVRSPDVVVDHANADRDLSTATPIFIAEVLSPSTTGKDFTEKLEEYTAIATLQTYLICSQDEPRAWVWARQGNGSWQKLPAELSGRNGTVSLGGFGIELTMAAIFRSIPDASTVG